MFSIDTGRLHEETYTVLEKLQHRYGNRIRIVAPDAAALERLVAGQGVNGFYSSVEARDAVLPRAQGGTLPPRGRRLRRLDHRRAARAVGRRAPTARPRNGTPSTACYKVSPLLEWSEAEVWQYIRARALPYNILHDRQYPSIGCSPCTRAIQPGESRRAGRWWWEQTESRECGLHPRNPLAGQHAAVA